MGAPNPLCADEKGSTMAGRKPKNDAMRIEQLADLIAEEERLVDVHQKRAEGYREERAKLLAQFVVGQMEVRNMNYPETESLLMQLIQNEPTPKQLEVVEAACEEIRECPEPAGDKTVQMIIRVSEKEREQIHQNMKLANYGNFNAYARKILLDGYLILWTSPETKELSRELGAINRSLNQLVKRANTTGSIYAGDTMDMLNQWQQIQDKVVRYLNVMRRKSR